jgi:hypothetical protein
MTLFHRAGDNELLRQILNTKTIDTDIDAFFATQVVIENIYLDATKLPRFLITHEKEAIILSLGVIEKIQVQKLFEIMFNNALFVCTQAFPYIRFFCELSDFKDNPIIFALYNMAYADFEDLLYARSCPNIIFE